MRRTAKRISIIVMAMLPGLYGISGAAAAAGPGVAPAGEMIVFRDGLLSVDAREVDTTSFFKQLGEVCGMKVSAYDSSFPEPVLSIALKDVPLVEAVKKLIKAAGADNYLMQIHHQEGAARIEEIIFLNGGTRKIVLAQKSTGSVRTRKGTPTTALRKRPEISGKRDGTADTQINQQIEALDGKFQWDNKDTAEVVKALLKDTPPQVRKFAYSRVTKLIEGFLKNGENDVVDRDMAYRAALESVSESPEMQAVIKEYFDNM